MARYLGPPGEVEAFLLDEDRLFESGHVGKKGEWLVITADGARNLVSGSDFAGSFRQVFPRMEGVEMPRPEQGPKLAS